MLNDDRGSTRAGTAVAKRVAAVGASRMAKTAAAALGGQFWFWLVVGLLLFIPLLLALVSAFLSVFTASSTNNSGSQEAIGEIQGVKYADIINEAAARYGVDPALIAAVAKAESNFNPKAGSQAGARGVMQVMPFNAKGANLWDPRENIFRGTEILSSHIKKYDGDLEKALAAYNAGPGAVSKYNGIPPYKETQAYVPKVMKYYKQYQPLVKNGKLELASGSLKGLSPAENYPYKNASTSGVDRWKFYNRQCTSFVAWRLNDAGIEFHNFMKGGRFGNAENWAKNARKIGFKVNKTPKPGAVAQWDAGAFGHSYWGHVAYVTQVDGAKVTIEEYNYKRFRFSRRVILAHHVSNYIHFE